MGRTTFDAYRIGDAAGPGIDAFAPGVQVPVMRANGHDWVPGPGQGGVSMRLKTNNLKYLFDRWWFLPAGSNHLDSINLVKDGKNHASWEPVKDMRLDDYTQALRQIAGWQMVP